MDPITITKREEESENSYVTGRLNQFPGWTFWASVSPEVDWESDCWTNHAGTRLREVELLRDEESYISIPTDAYDGRDIPLEMKHEVMLEQIDLFIGPSPEERSRLSAERDAERDRVFGELTEFVEHHLQDATPEAVARAADRLRDESRCTALEKMRRARAARGMGFER